MAVHRFSWGNFLVRLLFACVLVLGTYNPSGYSYFHWALTEFPATINAVSAFVGIVLIIGWVMFLRATWYSLGPVGLVLALAFFGILVWLLIDLGLLTTSSTGILSWIIVLIISAVLAIGMSWSHVRRRISGQIDMDDVHDEN